MIPTHPRRTATAQNNQNKENPMKEKRTITNESGKAITIMFDPERTYPYIYSAVEWIITPAQWRRLVRESDNTPWKTERGATIAWTCYPYASGCKHPGRK